MLRCRSPSAPKASTTWKGGEGRGDGGKETVSSREGREEERGRTAHSEGREEEGKRTADSEGREEEGERTADSVIQQGLRLPVLKRLKAHYPRMVAMRF